MDAKQNAIHLTTHRKRSEALKDEVYRQMFRLEARRPGAERDLAVSLLHAWMAWDSEAKAGVDRAWLRKICPICLTMIEATLDPREPERPCPQ